MAAASHLVEPHRAAAAFSSFTAEDSRTYSPQNSVPPFASYHASAFAHQTKCRRWSHPSCSQRNQLNRAARIRVTSGVSRGLSRGSALSSCCSVSSLANVFTELKKKNEVAFIPFLTAGDPDLETTERALLALDEEGANIIELGVPYSDPLADGPVIQAAATRALNKHTDLASVLDLMRRVSPKLRAPIVLFTYYNPIMKRGVEKFIQDAKACGAAGLVVPDIPLEETGPLRKLTTENGLELVLLTTPTTPLERAKAIAEATQGFLYLVSVAGVTGARSQVAGRVEGLLSDLQTATDKPIAVGFGISAEEHAAQVTEWGADGIIVGSALVKALGEAASPTEGLEAMRKLARSLKKGSRKLQHAS